MSDQVEDPQRWRTVAETAQHFHIGKDAVYEGVKNDRWPHRRNGRHRTAPILFDPVQDWPVIAELMRPASAPAVPAGLPHSLARIERGMKRLPQSKAA